MAWASTNPLTLILLSILVDSWSVRAFHVSSTTTATRLQLISSVFGAGLDRKEPQLPKDIPDAISKCREAVQKGLQDRISRMHIEMPVGAKFGVENKESFKNRRERNLSPLTKIADGDETSATLTLEKLDTSNRELARLFVEMFQPLGASHICAVFNDEYLADLARQRWSNDLSAECNIIAIDQKGKRSRGGLIQGNKGIQRKKRSMGFAAKLATELEEGSGPFSLPKNTEVAIFVAPGPKELIAIERICNDMGMGTCIITLNARLSLIDKYTSDAARKLFTEEFEMVWYLSAAPQDEAPGCLMHRSYPGPWILARKPKVGAPKTIALKDEGFNRDDCKDAFSKVTISDLEKGAEKLAENMANWFG